MAVSGETLQPPVDLQRDHIDGPPDASVTLLEYGDYQCRYCRRAHEGIRRMRDERLGSQMRYVFRHFPNDKLHPDARLAAQAAEAAALQGAFWPMHNYLFEHQDRLDRAGLLQAAEALGLARDRFERDLDSQSVSDRVDADIKAAQDSAADATPTFYVNGRRYDGPWDNDSVMEAVERPLGLKLHLLARAFAGLSISTGLMMLVAVVVAMLWANVFGGYEAFWSTELGINLGERRFALSLHEWINDGLIVIFFFVVGLEIKREVLFGDLADPRRAALPVAAAIGGMAVPAAIYFALNSSGSASSGWGVPVATDTAFALALLTMLGRKAPIALTVFVAALAIADDVGAILVLALFYTEHISPPALAAAAALFALLVIFNRVRIYRPLPYALVGVAMWVAILVSGLHTTTAGVLLALAIPSRPSPSTSGLFGQTVSAFSNLEAPASGNEARNQHYERTVSTLETVLERLLSPAQRLERGMQPWSSYLILPLFALANAGVELTGEALRVYHPLGLGIILGLVVGKPLGITLGAWLATKVKLASPPKGFSWRQLAGGSALCGIGFTMSIFVATAAFNDEGDLALAKASAIVASVLAGCIGWFMLRSAPAAGVAERDDEDGDGRTPHDERGEAQA